MPTALSFRRFSFMIICLYKFARTKENRNQLIRMSKDEPISRLALYVILFNPPVISSSAARCC